MTLIPEIDISTWWTSLGLPAKKIIELYHQHGTSEQSHSELKTDMDLERLPSGKFATNARMLSLGLVAYCSGMIYGYAISAKKQNRANLTKMERLTFTDFDAFRATNPHLDGQWLINGGSTWRWSTGSLVVGQSSMVRCYANTGVITEGVESSDAYHFYTPFRRGVWRNSGVGFGNDSVLIVEPGAEYCTTTDSDQTKARRLHDGYPHRRRSKTAVSGIHSTLVQTMVPGRPWPGPESSASESVAEQDRRSCQSSWRG